MDQLAQFNKAEDLYLADELNAAVSLYSGLASNRVIRPLCFYRLAQISNRLGDPSTAYDLFYKAFSGKNDINTNFLPEQHPNYQYIFKGLRQELTIERCPLCGAKGQPYWCYPLTEAAGYNAAFNPVRMWLHCGDCHHLFAQNYPENLYAYGANAQRKPNTALFPAYSNILSRIGQYAKGFSLLEVGIGACECILVAREAGYDVLGIDVIESNVNNARNRYGLPAQTCDFLQYEPDKKWDVIIMGDVLEHVLDPVRAIEKASALLNDDGALWISTPNFESSFTMVVGHDDPMRRQLWHLNYFSRESLMKLLQANRLMPVDFQISAHYNGSMEVISVKQSEAM